MKTLIQLSGINRRYGARVIFDDASASFQEKQKIGVLGRNGAGKSTMLRIIIGEEETDGGQVILGSDLQMSYLEQKDPYKLDESVMEFLTRYTGKESYECGKIAGRFGLKNELLDATLGSLPGGFRMRVKLTAMLLREPNFLLLDEPTNYLDLNTLLLLENFLRSYNGGYLIVSHDREFLMKTCDHTLEVERGKLFLFPGDVEEFLAFKKEDLEQKIRYNKNIESRQKEMEGFINRFRSKSSRASLVQSRVKQLEKLQKVAIDSELSSVKIKLPDMEKKHGIALKVEDLDIGYPDRTVATGINTVIDKGKRIAVLGQNGQGKTTFLRTIAGEIPSLSGNFRWGPEQKIAHYAQHVYVSMKPDFTVLEHLTGEAAKEISRQEILNMAGAFLFGGDDVDKKIGTLSGGERARACLAGMLLSRSDVLLLDEPTNHLDFETVEALGKALTEFKGTIFLVSHDRTFVNLTATDILEVAGGEVSLFPGSYEDYIYRLTAQSESESNVTDKDDSGTNDNNSTKEKSRYQLRKEKQSLLKKNDKQKSKLESDLTNLEKEKQEILKYFTDHPEDYSRERNERLEEIEKLRSNLEEEWLSLEEEIDALSDEIEELK